MYTISKEKLLLLFIGGFLTISLFKADVLTWKGEFGLSEVLNVILASLTVYAVKLSSKATESAKEAALYSKSQTLIMEKEFHNSHSPKLLPIPSEASLSIVKMRTDFEHVNIYSQTTDVNIQITNVYQGNAYMTSAWLEIEKEDLVEFYSCKSSSTFYKEKSGQTYQIKSHFPNNSNKKELHISTIEKNPRFNKYEEHTSTLLIRNEIRNQAAILRYNEHIVAQVPIYTLPIFLDILYRAWQDHSFLDKRNSKIIKLKVKCQTGDQIDSDNYTLQTYSLVFSNLTTPNLQKDDYGNYINNNFRFSIHFEKINDVPQ